MLSFSTLAEEIFFWLKSQRYSFNSNKGDLIFTQAQYCSSQSCHYDRSVMYTLLIVAVNIHVLYYRITT